MAEDSLSQRWEQKQELKDLFLSFVHYLLCYHNILSRSQPHYVILSHLAVQHAAQFDHLLYLLDLPLFCICVISIYFSNSNLVHFITVYLSVCFYGGLMQKLFNHPSINQSILIIMKQYILCTVIYFLISPPVIIICFEPVFKGFKLESCYSCRPDGHSDFQLQLSLSRQDVLV